MDALAAQAQHLEGDVDRDMRLGTDDDRDIRRTEQALPLDVPAGSLEQGMPRGRERREVGHRRAAREADA